MQVRQAPNIELDLMLPLDLGMHSFNNLWIGKHVKGLKMRGGIKRSAEADKKTTWSASENLHRPAYYKPSSLPSSGTR